MLREMRTFGSMRQPRLGVQVGGKSDVMVRSAAESKLKWR
jgi:hypothetical protein